jgi:peptide/nickel transport system substrate-binding protein
MPEPTTRLAALRSGQVDWIEVPPPDSILQLKGAGFQIAMNSYPHNWTHTLRLDKEPWSNKLVRKAANYAVDRVGICKSLLNDTCVPATGVVYKGHPWFGKPKEVYEYNPAKAKELLRQAGFDGTKHPAKAVHLISTSGSGQMLPLAMNELIQKNLKEVGIDVDLQPVEWNTLLTRWRAGFKTADNEGLNAWNISWNFLEPWSGFGRFFHSKSVVPVSVNTMPYINPEADKLIDEAERTFDVAKQNEILARLHEVIVDDAPWIFVVHDQNPRALSAKVKGFVQPQSWFVDLTAVTVR